MAPELIAALVTGAASLVGTGLNSASTAINTRRQYDYWLKQNEVNVENWKMQNEYNSPANQMKRYAEAGLNPNLIYGQSNEAGAIQSPGALSIPDYDLGGQNIVNTTAQVMQMYRQSKLDEKNMELIDQKIAESKANQKFLEDKAAGVVLNNEWNTERNLWKKPWFRQKNDELFYKINGMVLRNKGMELQNSYLENTLEARIKLQNTLQQIKDLDLQLFRDTYEYRKNNYSLQNSRITKQIELWEKQMEKLKDEMATNVTRRNLYRSQRYLNSSISDFYKKKTRWYDAEMFLNSLGKIANIF